MIGVGQEDIERYKVYDTTNSYNSLLLDSATGQIWQLQIGLDDDALYNWPAIMTGDLCPSGWHVSTDEDFTNLTNSLGGEAIAGYEMKTSSLWGNYAIGTNSSGFNGKPSGAGFSDWGMMNFDPYNNQNVAYFWTTTLGATGYPSDPFRAFTRKLDSYNHSPQCPKNNNNSHDRAFSARCVRD